MNKILFFFLALFVAVAAAQNATEGCEWTLLDASTPNTFSIQFWNVEPEDLESNSTGYWVTIPTQGDQVVTVTPTGTPGFVACNETNWSKTVVVTSKQNKTSATWYLTADISSNKYINAQVSFSGVQNTLFTWETFTLVAAMTGNTTNLTISTSGDTELTFDDKDAFFKIKTDSVSFTSATGTNETNPESDLEVVYTQVSGSSANIWVEFDEFPNDNGANYTAQNVTVYFGAGSPPGNHLLLIILVSVGGAVLLAIIIFVVIFVVRRRRNYERID